MKEPSRRHFLFASSGAAAGSFLAPGISPEQESGGNSTSGLITGTPKPLRYESIPGFLSAKQLAPHHIAHYGGALRGYTAADEKLHSGLESEKRLDSSAYGAVQRARTSKGNSVLLHELYFDQMVPKSKGPAKEIRTAIEKRFGTFEHWSDDFRACAKSASGWAILTFHPVSQKLYNVISDEHAVGLLWMATPLLVIDVYEHAFYVDYQNRKAQYIDRFMDHIDWIEVESRLTSIQIHQR